MTITRIQSGARMSQAVVHGDTVYLAGQVGAPGESVTNQTQAILGQIEALLAEAGSEKAKILSATIWLADMADFAEMNAVWDKWIDGKDAPARATGEARLATPTRSKSSSSLRDDEHIPKLSRACIEVAFDLTAIGQQTSDLKSGQETDTDTRHFGGYKVGASFPCRSRSIPFMPLPSAGSHISCGPKDGQ